MAKAVYFQELIESLKRELEWINDNGYTVALFVNDVDPFSDVELADYDLAVSAWAAPKDLDAWDPDAVTYDAPRAVAVHPALTWTPDGLTSEEVYGFITLDGLGALAWAERFDDGPYVIGPSATSPLVITPKHTRRSEFNSEAP